MFLAARGKGFVCWNAKQAKYTPPLKQGKTTFTWPLHPLTNVSSSFYLFCWLSKISNPLFLLRVYREDLCFLLFASALNLAHAFFKKKTLNLMHAAVHASGFTINQESYTREKGPQWGTKTGKTSSRLQNELNSSTKTTDIQFKPRATSYLQRRHQLLLQCLIHLCLSSKIKEVPDRKKNSIFKLQTNKDEPLIAAAEITINYGPIICVNTQWGRNLAFDIQISTLLKPRELWHHAFLIKGYNCSYTTNCTFM